MADVDDSAEEEGISLLESLPPDVLLCIFLYLNWNDLCQVSATCTKFSQICKSTSLWMNLRSADFRCYCIPEEENILSILKKAPYIKKLTLGDVILVEDDVVEMETDDDRRIDNLTASDRFFVKVLTACTHLTTLNLYITRITDTAVDAICAKCMYLKCISLHDNHNITPDAIQTLLSYNSTLEHLELHRCEQLDFIRLKHKDTTKLLSLKSICLSNLSLVQEDVRTLVYNCPQLTKLHITSSKHLINFYINIPQGHPSGLDSLEEISLTAADALEKVNIPYCPKLKSLDLSMCLILKKVDVSCPLLKEVSMTGSTKIMKLHLASCNIEEINCDGMTTLRELSLQSTSLHTASFKKCIGLECGELLGAFPDRSTLTSLDISGCRGLSPSDVSEQILTEFDNLQCLSYGGHSWNSIQLSSNKLAQLSFKDCHNTTHLSLNLPTLTQLTLKGCRDFTDHEFIGHLIYGKPIPRVKIISKHAAAHLGEEEAFNDTGVPNLCILSLNNMPGIHGDVLCQHLVRFKHLTTLEFIRCVSIVDLRIVDWAAITFLTIESCSRLSSVCVADVPALSSLIIRYCSMVANCSIACDSLGHLDLTGTNFAHLSLTSTSLQCLDLYGVCCRDSPENTLCLRCDSLEKLSISKCDRLSDSVMSEIFQKCPKLHNIKVIGSLSLRNLSLPSRVTGCSMTGHRLLSDIQLESPISLTHLTLNSLRRFKPAERNIFIAKSGETLQTLEVRAIPGEKTLSFFLPALQSLTLDQGVHLTSLEIKCPKLKYLRIQGCPRLATLTLTIAHLSQIVVTHSSPLLKLQCLHLYCHSVVHLSKVLAYYCPNIEELCITGSRIRADQLHTLATTVDKLGRVSLYNCTVITGEQTLHLHTNSPLVIPKAHNKCLTVEFHKSNIQTHQ